MKFSENWLREHVEVTASRDELVARLTLIGLEVEDVTEIGGALEGVVVAQILKCAPHPQADRLQVCQVDAGFELPLQIVCGAPNARPGLKAPLALIGATLPGPSGPSMASGALGLLPGGLSRPSMASEALGLLPGGIAIKAATLRGIESSGMLCSAKELGLDLDTSGLMELPADAPVGAALAEVLGLPDASIQIKLTPNRADCFSVRGIAFDVAAACGTKVRPHTIAAVSPSIPAQLAIALDAGADCARYCGRVIEGIDAQAATPQWMHERLKRSGLRSISLLVDVTAYVMLELGQPMHAYDADKLRGPISVRRARAGERLKLLDEREVALDSEFLVIADDAGPVGLAGVMGGFDSRVTDATRNVFLEAAHFAPEAIAGRARRLGMHTDASQRFERGVDPGLPQLALEYATGMILRIAGGKAGPINEAAFPAHLPIQPTVTLRRNRLARVLGVHVGDAEVERILRALGMHVEGFSHGWTVTPPSRRFDIAIEEDLIEEIARIHGYERIPTAMPSGEIRAVIVTESRVPESEIRGQLAARDYLEAINYAFVDAAVLAQWKLDANAVVLANPLSSELGVMRTALLPGLVEALRRNRTRQQERVRLFELGRVFGLQAGDAPLETPRVAAVACGRADAEQWGESARAVDFHDLKADLESVAALAGIDPSAFHFKPANAAWLHPGRSAEVWRDATRLGWIGHLHPRLLKALDLDVEVVGFELDLEPLAARAIPQAGEQSRFPLVRRDLALVVPEATPWAALEGSLRHALGALLCDLQLFDVYRGTGLEPGTKSLAMGLILQDVSRTLTDHDADRAVADAVSALRRDCGARIR